MEHYPVYEYTSHYLAGNLTAQMEKQCRLTENYGKENWKLVWADVTMVGRFMVFRREVSNADSSLWSDLPEGGERSGSTSRLDERSPTEEAATAGLPQEPAQSGPDCGPVLEAAVPQQAGDDDRATGVPVAQPMSWNAKIKSQLTEVGDRFYAEGCPYWEMIIAIREWLEYFQKSGAAIFGTEAEYLASKAYIEWQLAQARLEEENGSRISL